MKSIEFPTSSTVLCEGLPPACPCKSSCWGSHSTIIREVPQGGDHSDSSGCWRAGTGEADQVKEVLLRNKVKLFSSETCVQSDVDRLPKHTCKGGFLFLLV